MDVEALDSVLARKPGVPGSFEARDAAGADFGMGRGCGRGGEAELTDAAVTIEVVLAEDSARLLPTLSETRDTQLVLVLSGSENGGKVNGARGVTGSGVGSGVALDTGDSERKGGSDDLNAAGRDVPTAAADAALPRGMRSPVPGPIADRGRDLEGKDIEADLRLECDMGLRDNAGVGEVSRLRLAFSYSEVGREEEPEPERFRSFVVVIRRRVSADGASSSSLEHGC